MLGVVTACLGVVMIGMRGVTVRRMGVVRCLLVIAAVVVLGGLAVMMSGFLVVLGRLVVVLRSLMRHGLFSPLHSAHTRLMRLLWG